MMEDTILKSKEEDIKELVIEILDIFNRIDVERDDRGLIKRERFGDLNTFALMLENLAHRVRCYIQVREIIREKQANFKILN